MKLTSPTENASDREVRAFLRKLVAVFNHQSYEFVTAATTDATATTLWEYEVPENAAVQVEARVVAVTDDVAQAAGYFRRWTFRRVGSAAVTSVGSVTLDTDEDAAGWDAALAVSATTGFVEVAVTGAAATNIEWRGLITVLPAP